MNNGSNSAFIITNNTRLSRKIRLIDVSGGYKEDMDLYTAMHEAHDNGLDLVCIDKGDNNKLPLCKMMNYGKWKYEQDKKQKENEKHGKRHLKEMKFTPDIAQHDIDYKVKQINEFLNEGDDVLVEMNLRGRQINFFNLAEEKFNSIVSLCVAGKEVSRKKTERNITVKMVKTKQEKKGRGYK